MPAFTIYDKFREDILSNTGTINFGSDTFKVGLVTVTYTPATSDQFWSTPAANEVSGTNYSAGGSTSAVTTDYSTTTKKVTFADTTFSQNAAGFTNARYAVVYKSTGVAGTSPLVGYVDFAADKGNVSGDLIIDFPVSTTGTFTLA